MLTIDPRHRIVEGIATDGHTIWISSVLDRQILACRRSCRVMATLPSGFHPFAIAWDDRRKRLWVAADCPPGVAGIAACERGSLIGFDRTGKIRLRISPVAGSFHPGDVSVSGGRVFISDSQNGLVFELLSRGNVMKAINLADDAKSGQGTALSPDGTRLLIADYSRGVGWTDVSTSRTTVLPRPDGKPLRGIDGLVRCGPIYYGIYNGSAPGTLVAIRPAKTGLTFDQVAILPDPTQLAIDGKRLLIVADSGWASLDKPGFVRTKGATIVAIRLKCPAQ